MTSSGNIYNTCNTPITAKLREVKIASLETKHGELLDELWENDQRSCWLLGAINEIEEAIAVLKKDVS